MAWMYTLREHSVTVAQNMERECWESEIVCWLLTHADECVCIQHRREPLNRENPDVLGYYAIPFVRIYTDVKISAL